MVRFLIGIFFFISVGGNAYGQRFRRNPVLPLPPPSTPSHSESAPKISPNTENTTHDTKFECVQIGKGWQPRRIGNGFRPLGRDPMGKEDCDRAVANARNGVVCSHTGLGWKPTHHSGSTPYRRDYGFWGSSMRTLEPCLQATLHSSRERGVCYWGGSAWYIADIEGRSQHTLGGPFPSVDACITVTAVPDRPNFSNIP